MQIWFLMQRNSEQAGTWTRWIWQICRQCSGLTAHDLESILLCYRVAMRQPFRNHIPSQETHCYPGHGQTWTITFQLLIMIQRCKLFNAVIRRTLRRETTLNRTIPIQPTIQGTWQITSLVQSGPGMSTSQKSKTLLSVPWCSNGTDVGALATARNCSVLRVAATTIRINGC